MIANFEIFQKHKNINNIIYGCRFFYESEDVSVFKSEKNLLFLKKSTNKPT